MASALAHKWRPCDVLLQGMRFKRVARLVPARSTLLDIGCGDGAFLNAISSKISWGVGLDAFIDRSVRSGNCELIKHDLRHGLPFGCDSFDVITALAIVEHMESTDVTAFFNEAYRVLKPSGKLVFTTPAPAARRLLEFLAFDLHIISEADISDHKQYFGLETIRPHIGIFPTISYSTFQLGLNQLFVASK